MNQGVASFRNAKYNDAVEHFKQAAALEPDNPNGSLYLATAYMVQWIPGAESPENVEFSNKAKEGFMKVLEKDPNNTTALASLASLAYNAAQSLPLDKKLEKYDEAAGWNKKRIAADDKDKEAYYMLGVISWAKWYPALNLARVNLHMKPEDPGPLKDKKVKDELKAQYGGDCRRWDRQSSEGNRHRQGIRRRHGLHEPADPRKGGFSRQPGRIQERCRDRRWLGAEGFGYKEDQGCPAAHHGRNRPGHKAIVLSLRSVKNKGAVSRWERRFLFLAA